MAGKPIKIEFVAEVAQYLRDTKKLEVSTEDVAQALVSVSNGSQDLERKLARALRDAEKDAGTLEQAIKDLPKATERAADAADRDFDRLGDAAKDAGREVGDEFRQNLGESLASGNLEDIVSDTLGGIVGSLKGPLGLAAAGVAGVAALAFNFLRDDWQQTVEAMGAAAQALVQKQIEVGRQFLFQQEKLEIMQRLLTESPEEWAEVRRAAEKMGYTLEDVLGAMLGTTAEADAFKDKLKQAVREGSTLEQGTGRITLSPAAQSALDLLQKLGVLTGETNKANEAFLNVQSALGRSTKEAERLQANLKLARDYANGISQAKPFIAGPGKVAV